LSIFFNYIYKSQRSASITALYPQRGKLLTQSSTLASAQGILKKNIKKGATKTMGGPLRHILWTLQTRAQIVSLVAKILQYFLGFKFGFPDLKDGNTQITRENKNEKVTTTSQEHA
jgi:hypothetical protein